MTQPMAGSGITVDVCKQGARRVIGGVKPRILVFGTIEQEGLIFTSVALSICLLCVSLIATRCRKRKFVL